MDGKDCFLRRLYIQDIGTKDPVRKSERTAYILELRFRNCKPVTNAKKFQVEFHPFRGATINGLVLCQDITAHDKLMSDIRTFSRRTQRMSDRNVPHNLSQENKLDSFGLQ